MHLVPNHHSPDLVEASKEIANGVESGDIIGLGVVVQLRGGKFFVDVLGRMIREPYSARGWLLALDDRLREIGEERRERPTQ